MTDTILHGDKTVELRESDLLPSAIKAIQELSQQVKDLQAEINTLKGI